MLTNTTEIGTAILPRRRVTLPARTDVSPSAQRPAASDTPNAPARPTAPTAPPRRPPLVPALARAALACVLALAALATPAFAQTTVPAGWSLTPTGLAAGDQFRLLFLSSTKHNGSVTTIATYNTFIQNLAAAGHADIQAYSTGFRVVGCTADVDARDNTSTTGTGVPIYWLGGAKVADTYADFYDGSWDDEANDKNESGTDGPDTSLTANFPFTGCDHDGTEVIESGVSRALGSILSVRTGRPNSSTTGHGPISSGSDATTSTTRPMYGLSAVFQVGADTTPPTLTSATILAGGQIIELQLSENVQRSNLPPASAFTVTAGGSAVTLSLVLVPAALDTYWISVPSSSVIRQGQAVVVTYTDPTAGDDANAIQDTVGNDAASFTTGMNSVPAVTNNSTVNNPPTFSAATAARNVAENTAAGQNVGANLTATDADSDTLTYTLEGTDAASFDIVTTSGSAQIRTKTGVTYNHEAKASYTVIVKADDGNGGTDTITVTITVTDVTEPPGVPAAPSVTATAGSTTSLDVSWTAPANTGPAITSYDLQYRQGTSGNFTDGPQDVTGTSAAIGSLTANTSHEVQVRATNAEGDGDWSLAGTGQTGTTASGICGRTEAVRDAILEEIAGVSDCAAVTTTHLAAIDFLELDGADITALAAGDFAGLISLETLWLTDNALPTLPAGVFAGLASLTDLNLSNNGLPTLPAGVFAGLTSLGELNLSNNGLTTLPAGVFAGLTLLELLYLSNNALPTLPAGVFAGLTSLGQLNLDYNALTTLPDAVFAGLTSLELLYLNNNDLSTLPDGVFAGLTSLTDLYLHGNPGAPFAPTAVALPDDGTVSDGGGTVTLDGSGSGGAWGANVTYAWALTDPPSGVSVTFDNAASAMPVVTIPASAMVSKLTFTLTVTGRGGGPGVGPGDDTASVTVIHTLVVRIRDLSVREDIGTAAVPVTLSGPTQVSLSVPWETAGLDAVSPDDYTDGRGALTFAPGASTATIAIPIVDDAQEEAVESLSVVLGPGEGYRFEIGNTALVHILDNDGDDLLPSRATVNVTMLVLTYDEVLDSASTPYPFHFYVTVDDTRVDVDQVSVDGSMVTLALATAIQAGQTVTLDYVSGGAPIQDGEGNAAVSFSDFLVTNTTGGDDGTPPPMTATAAALSPPVAAVVALIPPVAVAGRPNRNPSRSRNPSPSLNRSLTPNRTRSPNRTSRRRRWGRYPTRRCGAAPADRWTWRRTSAGPR